MPDTMSDLDEQLLCAARDGDLPAVRAALGAGANIQTDEGSPLRVAAMEGHLDVVQYLLESGADIHAEHDDALRLAAYRGHLHVLMFLVSAGANLNAAGDHALQLPAKYGHVQVVAYLIEAGANLQAILGDLHTYNDSVQVAALRHGDLGEMKVVDLARQGVCPEALQTLLARQGHAELSSFLQATQMLAPLQPSARAEIVQEMLDRYSHAGLSEAFSWDKPEVGSA